MKQEREYLNEFNPDHFWTARRSMPPWHPPTPHRFMDGDFVVMLIAVIIALLALFGVWWAEGGL